MYMYSWISLKTRFELIQNEVTMHALGTAWAHSNEISTLQHTHVVVVLEVEVEVGLRVGLVLGSG